LDAIFNTDFQLLCGLYVFLENELSPHLEEVHLEAQRRMWLWHGVAPLHYDSTNRFFE
jgi:hypothetical protein